MIELIQALIDANQAYIGLFVLICLFAGFISERFPATVVAVLGACVFLLLGILDADELFTAFSNPAPITIGAMFVLSGALLRTGAIDELANIIISRAAKKPKLAMIELYTGAFFASAFMNNTPVVLVLIPIIAKLAKTTGYCIKKLLIPLSFVAILGGTTTLIGTSTNLLVDAVSREEGLKPFGIFEITPYGIIAALAGILVMVSLGKWLLPESDGGSLYGESDEDEALFITEFLITSESDMIGKAVKDIAIFKRVNLRPVAIKRGGHITRSGTENHTISSGDRVVIRTNLTELLSLRLSNQFEVGMAVSNVSPSEDDEIIEAAVGPNHPAIGQQLRYIPFLSNHRVRIIGVTRHNNLPGPDLQRAKVRVGDRIVVAGSSNAIKELRNNPNLMGIGHTTAQAFRRGRAPIAVAALAGVVALAGLNILPIAIAAILAVGAILFTRCIDADEAWGSIDGNVLVLIFSMLAVGLGLQEAGSIDLVVSEMTPLLINLPIWAVVITVYLMSVLLTEVVTNNAVAILITPLVIALAQDIGIDPRPLVIAVMLAASASFATPIGYQTNTLVYAAGNYRFTDFLKIGLPVSIGVGITNCAMVTFMYF